VITFMPFYNQFPPLSLLAHELITSSPCMSYPPSSPHPEKINES